MREALRNIGAGLAFAVVAGTAIHMADDLTGNNLQDLAMNFEEAVVNPEGSAFENSVARHPGSSLNLAIFALGVPLGAFGFRKIAKRAEKGHQSPSP